VRFFFRLFLTSPFTYTLRNLSQTPQTSTKCCVCVQVRLDIHWSIPFRLDFFFFNSFFILTVPVNHCHISLSVLSTVIPICDGNNPFLILNSRNQGTKIFHHAIFVKFSIVRVFANLLQEVSIKRATSVRPSVRPSVRNYSAPTGQTLNL